MEQLIIEASSIECNEERREISGKIVPMGTGEIGHTNMGGVVFEAGSIEIDDPSKIKLLSQHDIKKPIGRMVTATVRPDGIYATFKLSRGAAGTEIHRPGRTARRRTQEALGIVRRHEATRRHRARLCHRTKNAAAGRALRRTGCADPRRDPG